MFWHFFMISKKKSHKLCNYIIALYDYRFHFSQYCNYSAERLEEKDSQTYVIERGMFMGILW